MYHLHRNTSHGRYVFMGEFETDYVIYAFKDCVNEHTGDYVWVTSADPSHPDNYAGTLFHYDPDHHDYLEVNDWELSVI